MLLEGPKSSTEFDAIRRHILTAKQQSIAYSPGLKTALAWWTREFIDGMHALMGIPQDWAAIRTIIIFATLRGSRTPRSGDHLYFELPAGIQQIESLKTQVHLFIFDVLPADPWNALSSSGTAKFMYTCMTLGADNEQGIRDIRADWQIDNNRTPVLQEVPSGRYQPRTAAGHQQVHARIDNSGVDPLEYFFETEKQSWEPILSDEQLTDLPEVAALRSPKTPRDEVGPWQLVTGLQPKLATKERDEAFLQLAAPESGSFVLVSLRRRKRDRSEESMID